MRRRFLRPASAVTLPINVALLSFSRQGICPANRLRLMPLVYDVGALQTGRSDSASPPGQASSPSRSSSSSCSSTSSVSAGRPTAKLGLLGAAVRANQQRQQEPARSPKVRSLSLSLSNRHWPPSKSGFTDDASLPGEGVTRLSFYARSSWPGRSVKARLSRARPTATTSRGRSVSKTARTSRLARCPSRCRASPSPIPTTTCRASTAPPASPSPPIGQ